MAWSYVKHFVSIVLFNLHDSSLRKILLWTPFYRQGNRRTEKLSPSLRSHHEGGKARLALFTPCLINVNSTDPGFCSIREILMVETAVLLGAHSTCCKGQWRQVSLFLWASYLLTHNCLFLGYSHAHFLPPYISKLFSCPFPHLHWSPIFSPTEQ